ncbi:hypothetical protein PoB_001850400 [Plakobranchus ocellatus]|uniref:Uncharacterized protein n=1 Tax=Plakobranchus ocellatus TaxID=259542 RepID=A0AAV3ZCA0_9GAST|nr:hypothetical protein PoB_001850400 [Plakobranchus ocellatus]
MAGAALTGNVALVIQTYTVQSMIRQIESRRLVSPNPGRLVRRGADVIKEEDVDWQNSSVIPLTCCRESDSINHRTIMRSRILENKNKKMLS